MPFFPSPDRDDGYDITDFYGIDPRIGSHGELVEVLRTARDRGIRVIIDLVVNHTSDRHPWFVSAKRSRTSPFRDYYVWRDEPPKKQQETVFPGEESSVWELDEKSGQYFLHSFYSHQPDLNIANPRVRDEIAKVIGFWLQLGVSGFRVDAVPFLIEPPDGVDMGDPHEFLRDIKRFLQRRSSEAVVLGEVNVPYKEQLEYFGGSRGGELDLQFDFMSMQAMYLSLVRSDPAPLIRTLTSRPVIPPETAWANFVRNHDELTLDKLTEKQKQEVFEALSPDPSQRVYDRGITRRLPPMLAGDPRRVRMVYSLLFSLPGVPVLFYGEEIGMGENADIEGRLAVRTPMQWAPDDKGGFSSAARLALPGAHPGGRLRAAARQRRRPAQRRRLAAELHPPPRVALPAVARDRLGRVRGAAAGGARRARAQPARGCRPHDRPAQLRGCAGGGRRGPGRRAGRRAAARPVQRRGAASRTTRQRFEIELPPYGYRWLRVARPGDTRLG